MNDDYSVSGRFGEVKIYNSCMQILTLPSVSEISHFGWHRVNSLYKIVRSGGHYENLMLLTRNGTGKITINDRVYSAEKNSVFIIPKNVSNSYMAMPGHTWEFSWIHYSGENADNITRDIVREDSYSFYVNTGEQDSFVSELKAVSSNTVSAELLVSDILYRFLQSLLQKRIKNEYECVPNSLAVSIMNDIESDMQHRLSLSDMEKKYNYSREHIIRTFKKSMNMTPYSYKRYMLLKQSAKMLLETNKSINEISSIIGYSSLNSYSAQFKKFYKMSPKEYRKKLGVN